MNSPIKIFPHYTFADRERWEDQWELLEGIPYAMSPAPVPEHQRISANITISFGLALKSCNKSCYVTQPIDYKISDDTILQPDMLIICKPIIKKFLDFPPALVVEILSPSTALKDRNNKFYLYQQQGISYYLIIDPMANQVEVYVLNNSTYELAQKGTKFQYDFDIEGCQVSIDFTEIWS